jgi:WD40 repeat protein
MQTWPFRPVWLLLGLALFLPGAATFGGAKRPQTPAALGAKRPQAPGGDTQDRRGRRTPGLVLETGARHASCDVLQFTPSGDALLTAGDDKVVRVWPADKDSLHPRDGRILRWPIFREARGSIFALAQSPHDAGRHLAIGGFGILTGMLAVLDRDTGDVEHVLDQPTSSSAVWAIAWSPDGRYVVYGTGTAELFRWDVKGGARSPVPFAGTGGRETNHVRHITFVDGKRFVSVHEDGRIWLHDVTQPKATVAAPLSAFTGGDLIYADSSADRRWLAAARQDKTAKAGLLMQVEVIDLRHLLAAGGAAPGVRQMIAMPTAPNVDRVPMSVAFDTRGERLAVGMQEGRHLPKGIPSFSRVTGGLVHVWDLRGGKPARITRQGLEVGYRPDALVFRPGGGDNAWQLAVAGGPNNEVRLWDIRKEGAPLSTVRSPGSNIWSVALSENGKYLAWKDKLNTNPQAPNDRGTGDWRVFNLEGKVRRILPGKPEDFEPVAPIESLSEWKVQTGGSSFRWRILGPGTDVELSDRTGLYIEHFNQIPRCWTFLQPDLKAGKPPRLAVGHMWGVSIYELRPGKVRLARLLNGHESEVMAVAPSANGKLLVTAGRDQTIACWSLEDWPTKSEMGASFTASGGKLAVRKVDPGSPAWEAGLTDGDEVVMVVSIDRDRRGGFLYDPEKQGPARYGFRLPNPRPVTTEQVAALLANAEPAREYLFVTRQGGRTEKHLTTVRQRPLWRFFPTRKEAGSNWVLWRWRDYYYDTNAAEPDRLLGWMVFDERDLKVAPTFHPLSHFSGSGMRGPKGEHKGFHNPDKVWKFIKSTNQEPEKVIFPEIEPPEVRLRVEAPPDAKKKQPLVLRATARPRNPGEKQKLSRVVLWLDDFQYRALTPNADGVIDEQVTIPLDRLRASRNVITLSAFNNEGGRGQDTVVRFFEDPSRGKPVLHALCVGLNDYSKVKNFEGLHNLSFSEADAESLLQVFRQHKESAVYSDAKVTPLFGPRATRANILAELEKIRQSARPDDWVVLFLSGHGKETTTDDSYEPYSFAYISADSDQKRPATLLKARDLMEELSKIPCRKLILLDACHSGEVVDDPVRALNQDGPYFLIFAACKGHESALEPDPKKTAGIPRLSKLKHGLFTEGLLDALGAPEKLASGARRERAVTGTEVANRVKRKVDDLLRLLHAEGQQTPVFEPRSDDPRLGLPLFCRPEAARP